MWLRPMLAMLCFAVFALGVLSLHQEKMGRFTVDEEWPIPTALSRVMFGSPLGLADKALLRYFQHTATEKTTADAVERVAREGVTPTHEDQMPLDGQGLGPCLSATLAFELFGTHARSLCLLFLTLLGISTVAYVLRFRDERLWVLPVFLAALTFLLLSPAMELPAWATEAPLGGSRSYILLAILPMLHWCFEVVADESATRRAACAKGVLLGLQITILGIAILVRYSPICLIPAVLVSALLGLRHNRVKRIAVVFLIPLAALAIVLYGIIPLSFARLAEGGRLQTLVWHRAFISFSYNPEWPFPGLSNQYPCPQLEKGLGYRPDSYGACVWLSLPANQSRPAGDIWADLYGPQYELALRRAFFDVVFQYPGKAVATFLYYKPLLMVRSTRLSLIPWSVVPPGSVIALAVLQLLLLVNFLASEPARGRGVNLGVGVVVAAALVTSALIPHLIAWTNPATGQELTAGVLSAGIIGIWLSLRFVLRRVPAFRL